MLNEMKLEAVENFTGDTEKDGVVVKCKSGFNYYDGNGDAQFYGKYNLYQSPSFQNVHHLLTRQF